MQPNFNFLTKEYEVCNLLSFICYLTLIKKTSKCYVRNETIAEKDFFTPSLSQLTLIVMIFFVDQYFVQPVRHLLFLTGFSCFIL